MAVFCIWVRGEFIVFNSKLRNQSHVLGSAWRRLHIHLPERKTLPIHQSSGCLPGAAGLTTGLCRLFHRYSVNTDVPDSLAGWKVINQPLNLLIGKEHSLPVLMARAAAASLMGVGWSVPSPTRAHRCTRFLSPVCSHQSKLSCLISRHSHQYPVTVLLY